MSRALLVISLLAILAFGIFVWPTPYAYQQHTYTRYDVPVHETWRITRFTGHAERVSFPRPKPLESAKAKRDPLDEWFDPNPKTGTKPQSP